MTAAKFPPLGRRGFGSPLAMERFSPPPSMTEYLQLANDSLLTMVQIETREALDVVEDIAAIPGVDVCFVGPFDLWVVLPLDFVLFRTRLRTPVVAPRLLTNSRLPTSAGATTSATRS